MSAEGKATQPKPIEVTTGAAVGIIKANCEVAKAPSERASHPRPDG